MVNDETPEKVAMEITGVSGPERLDRYHMAVSEDLKAHGRADREARQPHAARQRLVAVGGLEPPTRGL
jgi:hypothetical protein